jgi:Sec-independent protein translocase protein TatA
VLPLSFSAARSRLPAGFVLGPQKLGQMARDLGAVAGELKDVPKEFQEVTTAAQKNCSSPLTRARLPTLVVAGQRRTSVRGERSNSLLCLQKTKK